MSSKKIVLKNIFSALLQKFISTIYYFIVPILIIKQYGSNVNGLISSITQFIAYISLLEFGIGPVVKYALYKPLLNKDSKEIGKVLGATSNFFKKIAYTFLLYIILLCIFYPRFINGFDYWYTFSLIVIISIGNFFEYFIGMTYKMFLQADQKNYVIDYTICITYIINIILIVFLIKFNFNIQSVKIITTLSYIARPIVLNLYFKYKYNYKIINDSDYKLPQQWDCVAHHIASVVQSNTDVVILTVFNNLINVSIYSVYSLVINGIRTIIQAFTNGIDAFFGKLILIKDEKKLREKFETYTFSFYTITTILLACTLILIIPFIQVYTRNISDTNYIQPIFAYIMVFAEFSFVIRYPYSNLVFAKGHFKQTSTFSIIEPIINIIISIILVIKFGLIGVAIGTLVSMLIRSIGFIVYGSKNILNVSYIHSLKNIIISYFELIIIFIIHLLIGNIYVHNYLSWLLFALIVFVIVSALIIIINAFIFKNDFNNALSIIFRGKVKRN